MTTSGQLEFIEDLIEKIGLTRDDLAAENQRWGDYERLPPHEASEVIEWLKDYGRS